MGPGAAVMAVGRDGIGAVRESGRYSGRGVIYTGKGDGWVVDRLRMTRRSAWAKCDAFASQSGVMEKGERSRYIPSPVAFG